MSHSKTPTASEDSLYTIDDIDTGLRDDYSLSNERLCNNQTDKTSQQGKGHELCIEIRNVESEEYSRNVESEGDSRIVEDDSPKLGTGGMAKEQSLYQYTEDGLGKQCKENVTKVDIKILHTDVVENDTKIRDNNLPLDHQNSEKNRRISLEDSDVCCQDMNSELQIKDRLGVDCGIPHRHNKSKEVIHLDDESTIDDEDNGSSFRDAYDDYTEEDADSEENLPVDKGWAWVVLAGTFLNTMLFVGYVKSLSILFVEYLRLFEASATTTSLIMGVLSATYSISALITMHFVLERLAVRKTALLGGLISTIAMATGVFAPNITFLICVHSVFTGIGHSMLLGPGLVLIGQYFNKRRGLAVSISMSSISVGAGVFPMLTRLLLDRYQIRGTMLIFTGLTMNIFVGASLFRPFDSKQRKTRKIDIKVDDSNKDTLKQQSTVQNHLNGSVQSVERELSTSKEQYGLQRERAKFSIREPLLRKRSVSLCESQEGQSPTLHDHNSHEEEPHCVQIRINTINPLPKDTEHNVTECSVKKRPLPRNNILIKEHLTVPLNQNSQGRGRTHSNGSWRSHHEDLASSRKLLYASNPETLSASVINLATTSDSGSDTNSQTEVDRRKPGCNIIDLTLFKRPMFRLFAVSAMFGIVSNIVPNYLPAFVNEKGIGQTDAALLLLLLGTVDFFSRIAIGYFVDLKIIRPSRLIAIGLICAGTSAQLARLYNTFPLMVMFSVIHGIVGSAYQSLVPILIVDFLGKEYLGKTLGYSSMFHGMSLAITHPIIGAIKDISGTFNNTYTYLGTCAYFAALCLLIGEPLCRRRDVEVQENSDQKV